MGRFFERFLKRVDAENKVCTMRSFAADAKWQIEHKLLICKLFKNQTTDRCGYLVWL